MVKKHYTFVLDSELNRKIEICAAVEEKQKSEVLREALEEYFEKKSYSSIFDSTELKRPQKRKKI